jgi:hypothetical protein
MGKNSGGNNKPAGGKTPMPNKGPKDKNNNGKGKKGK